MTNARIIYKTPAGGVAVVTPVIPGGVTPAEEAILVQVIAAKDVPTGLPYKIGTTADLPADRSQRDAWAVDEALLTDGVGA